MSSGFSNIMYECRILSVKQNKEEPDLFMLQLEFAGARYNCEFVVVEQGEEPDEYLAVMSDQDCDFARVVLDSPYGEDGISDIQVAAAAQLVPLYRWNS